MVGERGFEPPTPWSRTSPLRLTNFAKEINRLPSGDLACIMPHMGSPATEKNSFRCYECQTALAVGSPGTELEFAL